MATLPKEVTRSFYKSATGYEDLQAHWRELVNSDARHQLRADHYLLYAVLRGKDWRKGFTPCTNPTKLANGHRSNHGMWQALVRFHHTEWSTLEPFKEFLDPETLTRIRTLVPKTVQEGKEVGYHVHSLR